MNLHTLVKSNLWNVISSSYEAGNYKNAILDAMHYLTDTIREKADVDGDGVRIIGPAFGGASPRIKINKLQTQSERDAQSGVLKLLEGLYTGIRNPRSHEHIVDTRETADAIIYFINYLLGIIDSSKGPFILEEWMSRVFDPDFYPSERYAKLLASEVPTKRLVDTFIAIYRDKMRGNGEALFYIFEEIINRLNPEQLKAAIEVASEELRKERSEKAIIQFFKAFPNRLWGDISEDARLRIEYKLIETINKGTVEEEYYIDELNNEHWVATVSGSFGSWITAILPYLTLKEEFHGTIRRKLTSGSEEKAYVIEYFLEHLPNIGKLKAGSEENFMRFAMNAIESGIGSYPSQTTDRLRDGLYKLPAEWHSLFTKHKEINLDPANTLDEDIPF